MEILSQPFENGVGMEVSLKAGEATNAPVHLE
jgi:hypothetical protein